MVEDRPTRSQRRFNVSLPLWVRFRQPSADKVPSTNTISQREEKEELTTTMNMSLGGCFFYISQEPALGTPATMMVDVSAPGRRGRKVLCRGKVVRVNERENHNKVGVACTIDSYAFMPPDGLEETVPHSAGAPRLSLGCAAHQGRDVRPGANQLRKISTDRY